MTGATAAVLAAVGLLLASCGDSASTSSSSATTPDQSVPARDGGNVSPTTSPVTAPPTTAADPTIFNPNKLGDRFALSSFALTVVETHSNNGALSGLTTSYGYTRNASGNPSGEFAEVQYSSGDSSKDYFVDGRTYQLNNQGYWYLFENGSLAAPDILNSAKNTYTLSDVSTATYAGEEDFAGAPAYHFTFDQASVENGTTLAGDFYIARDGNYVLYAHSRMVASGTGYELIDEYTETMSSVDALPAIVLPTDLLPLKDALDLGVSLGIPMPADGALDSMINYNSGGIGVYYYQFTSSWTNETNFVDYYKTLQPTNGWTVTHVGQVKDLDVYCGDGNCAILKNGDQQLVLYFDGSNLHADFDREHRFGPCLQPVSPTACG